MDEIVNKVAQSGIITIDPEEFIPKGIYKEIDFKVILWQGQVLRESDLNAFIENHPWSNYKDTYVAIHCSADAVIPTWAYMKITKELHGFAKEAVLGTIKDLEEYLAIKAIDQIIIKNIENQRVVIKGCGQKNLSPNVYIHLTNRLLPQIKSLMFGEPCSTVPVFKKK